LPGEFKRVDPKGYDLVKFKEIYSKWNDVFASKGWGTIYLGNHDQPRMISRWGNDNPPFKDPSAKMLITFLLTMHATPFFFNGDEIGMTNIRFNDISEYRDIETLNMYKQAIANGGDPKRFIENQKESARDNSRTPFQWDESSNAGFTCGEPWLKVNPNYKEYNAKAQDKDPGSILNYFRRMTRLRKEQPTLTYGHYQLLDKDHKQVYAYTRTLNGEKFLILLNFSKEEVDYQLPVPFQANEEILINNYKTYELQAGRVKLFPYQAIVMRGNGTI
jgi:oligo-1,6-glucosidase